MSGVKVAVIGLGRMGSGYDGGKIVSLPRSHVGAILSNPLLTLAAVCDTSFDARSRFVADWNLDVPVFDSAEKLLAHSQYDIIVVATVPATHDAILAACLSANPALVFCEKPMCNDASMAAILAQKFAAASVQLIVNYHRRWDVRFSHLRDAIRQSGAVRHVELLYMKGLRNYGAHALDLLQFLFGSLLFVEPSSRQISNLPDPSYSATLGFGGGVLVNLVGVDNVDYELLDLDIVTQTARFSVDAGGHSISVRRAQAGRHFSGYTSLSAAEMLEPGNAVHGLTQAYAEMVKSLSQHQPVTTSSAENAVAVQQALDAIVLAAQSGKRVIL